MDVHPNLRLLGTAHIATSSVEAVKSHIESYQPDIVAVELCQSRYDTLVNDRRLDKESLLRVIKEGKAPMVLLQSMLSAEHRKLGMDEGQQPGAELLAAVKAADEAGCEVVLVDRDIQTTLRRAWKNMRFREKWSLLTSLLEDDDEDELDVDDLLNDSDLLSSMMEGSRVLSGCRWCDVDEMRHCSKIGALDDNQRVLAVLGPVT